MSLTLRLADRTIDTSTNSHVLSIGRDALPPRLRPDASLSVLDITEWFGETSGGIRTYVLEKARYISARPALRHVIAVPGVRDMITDDDGVRMYRLRGPRIPTQRPYRFMLATRSVSRIVRHEEPTLIEVGSPFLVPWIVRHATRDLQVPLVCYHHTNVASVIAPQIGTPTVWGRAVHRTVQRYVSRLNTLFPLTIVGSAYSARELAQDGITRVAQVPLGVDLDTFVPWRRANTAALRGRLGIPQGLVAGYVGRFAREKALDVVLDAWPEVERTTGARLVIAGAGPMEAIYRKHPYASRVCFLPFQQDRAAMADLLAALDVYVAPGPLETFGLAALEALASGTPVLTVNSGAVAEQIVASGAGRRYEPASVESVVVEAGRLFRDNLAALGIMGRTHAVTHHAWPRVLDRLFAVYRELLQ